MKSSRKSKWLARSILLGAAALYAAAVLSAWSPSRTSAGEAPRIVVGGANAGPTVEVKGLPFRAAAMQLHRVDWMDQYKRSLDEMVAVGFDTVELVVDTRMENARSTRIWLDQRKTPSFEQLSDLIDYAKSKGLRVVLMPIVLLDNPSEKRNEWRGVIQPDPDYGGWPEWFNSYREMIKRFAFIAEGSKADVLVVGSELVSTEDKGDEWTRVIKEVRAVYKGALTYSANWDHYRNIPFWDQLDLIGMNSYWKLDDGRREKATVKDISKRWQQIQPEVLGFVKRMNKPLFFTEVGWCSIGNASYEPWDYTKVDVPIDMDLQKRLYTGFFQSWHGNPSLGGFTIWDWPPGDGGPDDRGYTPKNKPAEAVLREWLAKPRWDVK